MQVPVEILGMVGTKEVSESLGSFDGPVIDTDYLTRFAQAHEAAGFDRVLIGYGASGPSVGSGRELVPLLREQAECTPGGSGTAPRASAPEVVRA